MARTEEVNDAPAAPVDSQPQNLVGDSMVTQEDSNLARTASMGSTDDAIAMLDPKGNEFRIDGLDEEQEQNFQNQQAQLEDKPEEDKAPVGERPPLGDGLRDSAPQAGGDKPPSKISPESAMTVNSEDGLRKNVVTGEGKDTLQFSPDGKLQSFTTRTNDGFQTTTKLDDAGRATSRTITNPSGESQNVDVLRGTRVTDTPTADGGRQISISERGKTNGFVIDSGGNIRESYLQQGLNVSSKTFDAKGDIQSDFTSRTADGKTTSTYTKAGFRETTTVNNATSEADITRVNQRESFTGKFDPSVQRTDNIHVNADGSSDATSKFRNEPGVTYKTRTGSDGRYQTDKVNDATGEQNPYKHGGPSYRRA